MAKIKDTMIDNHDDFAEKERDFLTGIIPKYDFKSEETITAKYCTNQDQCCDEERCGCVEVVHGAKVVFVGTARQLSEMFQ